MSKKSITVSEDVLYQFLPPIELSVRFAYLSAKILYSVIHKVECTPLGQSLEKQATVLTCSIVYFRLHSSGSSV
jgi:hypothetical protein